MIPLSISNKIGKNLHLQDGHPICTIKNILYEVFHDFKKFDNIPPLVEIINNFDVLRIPANHPSRKSSDTYYLNEEKLLRTHTSAHQVPLLKTGLDKFLVVGDVYRKDDINSTHYPVFHQMEGVCIVDNPEISLKHNINKVLNVLFPNAEIYWNNDYFPFTEPSWEVSVDFNGVKLEVLGCGIIHPEVLTNAGITGKTGWAFGLGLERLAMKLFDIPDIRLFWSTDERFLNQFEVGKISKFKPFSTHPICYKDIAFWIPDGFEKNNFFELVREIGGDLVESVEEIDCFTKNGRISLCYRINYRAMDRSLKNDEINKMQSEIREAVSNKMNVEIR